MMEKRLMIAGLKKQRELLGELILDLEKKPRLSDSECELYQKRTRLIETNLRKLRSLRSNCFDCAEN